MKNLCLLFVMAGFIVACGPQIYKAATLEQSKKKVRTVAIIPFAAHIDIRKLPKGVTEESIHDSEVKTGYDLQNQVYSEFLKRSSKDKYTVKFQDIDKTNALLKKNNITYDNLGEKQKSELCKLLNVDAIISGNIKMSKPMSDGAAVAIGVIFGSWGTTNETTVSLNIHDVTDELQWKYDHIDSGSVGSSSERLAKSLMVNVSRKFPYKMEQ
ncbi:MAG: hypothetical protein K1X68_13515 [Saprospiraceae bacterium]|nr:hypothetical protein [Saprospiraceae bacterium]HMW39269.1 hypothetical protein [Saprospiraceae bacterium]HMX89097.1 hypothetical protein [Saprospiraceae bacterium]HMZ40968.1 hypothetical protein [Saprospiraceae bacterium]HNA65105.1 hypothetical protein [Saprospiraceae bacterium]